MVQTSELQTAGRGKVLTGTVLAQIGLGTVYAWAIFNIPLATRIMGADAVASDPTLPFKIGGITFSIMMIFLSLSTLTINTMQAKFGVRKTLVACGILLWLGLFLVGVWAIPAKQAWVLYIFGGVVCGIGDGIGYLLSLTNCLRWYPDKAGTISGISVGSYGIPAVIIPFIFTPMMGAGPSYPGLVTTYIVWSFIALILVSGGGLLLKDAPVIKGNTGFAGEYTRKEMLKTPQAYMLWIGIIAFCLAGLYIIGTSGSAAKSAGVPDDQLPAYLIGTTVSIVALVGLVNTIGRFFFGWLSDHIKRTLIVACALTVLAVFAFILGASFLGGAGHYPAPWLYILVYLLFGLSFGGCITIYPTIVGEFFGKNNQAKNYSIIYQGFAIGAAITLIFNLMTSVFKVLDFGQTLIIAGVLLAIGAVLLFAVRPPKPLEAKTAEPIAK
ncbi:MAG: MFS transporter [Microbacteriaceae bacterium]|jgi:OFA family oxalate/formate antiporter-like MFS transporter|nr:MFS transporter [Microbacteriaceae bacterium]MCI1207123.1 MFS transporter [Microbacteriaceae bacterium]